MKAGIIGGGMIGAGWARLLRAQGHTALVYDERPELCDGAATLPEAVADAEAVFEAVAERLTVKRRVLAAIEEAAPPGALIGSASSSLLPSLLQEGLRRPERMLVIHPLHPVDLLPVIEVVGGVATAPEAVERAADLIRSLGKQPVVLKREVPGYVVNRLAAALWREAVNLVLTGVVDVQQLDLAASKGPCLGWSVQGPFLTYELAAPGGLGPFMAHLGPAFGAIWQSLSAREAISDGERTQLAAATQEAYRGRPRAEWEAERDRVLEAVLTATGGR